MNSSPFRPAREGLDAAAVQALRQHLGRITEAINAVGGNVRARLGDVAGATSWTVADAGGEAVLTVDSDGNLTVTTVTAGGPVWTLGEFVETAPGYVAKAANYTLAATDETVEYTSGSYTATLPTAVGRAAKVYNIKNSGNGVITINTTSSQTIDGNASGVLKLVQYDNLTVQSNGSNWVVL